MIFEYTTIFVHVRFVNEALFSVFCSVGFVKKKSKNSSYHIFLFVYCKGVDQ